MRDRIYLDHAATTPIRREAAAAVADGMARWANPSSPHAEGRAARRALEDARARIAAGLGWDGDVILTSGATEAIGIALRRWTGGRIAVAPTEHDAVLRQAGGGQRLRVDRDGRVSVADVLDGGHELVAVQSANSETGVLQPVDAIASGGRSDRPAWLADCSQSAGKLALPDADMIVVSAHKLGGPPGIGALLVRDLALLEAGGGQEQGYRGGTENLPGALGFAAALEAPRDWFDHAARWRAALDAVVRAGGGEVIADEAERIATVAAYRMPGRSAAAQLVRFDSAGFAVSAGSACSSGTLKASHVLSAMEHPHPAEVIRVSFGWSTTEAEVVAFGEAWQAMAR